MSLSHVLACLSPSTCFTLTSGNIDWEISLTQSEPTAMSVRADAATIWVRLLSITPARGRSTGRTTYRILVVNHKLSVAMAIASWATGRIQACENCDFDRVATLASTYFKIDGQDYPSAIADVILVGDTPPFRLEQSHGGPSPQE